MVEDCVAVRKQNHVVAGLIYRDDRLLLCQRHGDSTFSLKWDFPGGKIEEGEKAVDALRRALGILSTAEAEFYKLKKE
jgi:8-oxo-dGTP diphosphatase